MVYKRVDDAGCKAWDLLTVPKVSRGNWQHNLTVGYCWTDWTIGIEGLWDVNHRIFSLCAGPFSISLLSER